MTGAARVQILWRWKRDYVARGCSIGWRFAAHGATYERADAESFAALLRSHGKETRFLPVTTGTGRREYNRA